MGKQLYRLLALLFGFVLIAASCGGGDDTEAGGGDDESTDTTAAADDAESGGDDDEEVGGAASEEETAEAMAEAQEQEASDNTAAADSFEGLQELWASERQAIIDELNSGDYGLGDDGILRAPGGFELDTNNCPGDWSNTEGVEDGVIKIGHTAVQSGQLAAYGNISVGMDAYFEWVNETGGIGPEGYQIELIIKDDEYIADRTIEFVAELLQSDKPYAITTMGSPNTFAVYNTLNEACVPHPMAVTGHQAWGDPIGHPWTTGLQMSYATESLLWGTWIEENFTDPVTVAALVMDNDFGLAYEQGFLDFAANSDLIDDVEVVRHDPAAATLTNEITTLANVEPDVFISMTAGNACLLAIQEAARAGITEISSAFFTPSVCKSIASYMEPAGEASDQWYIIGGGIKDNTDPQWDDDPYISWVNSQLEEAGLDPEISLQGEGYGNRGWTYQQVLEIAANLDGGLTRTNLILAQRGLSQMSHPMLLEGIGFGMNGSEDAYYIEGSEISQFDAGSQTWVQQGGIIDLSGKSPNCAWVPGEGC